jgi:VWFA-related protein
MLWVAEEQPMDRTRLLPVLILSLIALRLTVAQNQNPGAANQTPTFKANVRVVLVDVVVTEGNDEPVTGLKREQFQVFEDGKPQTLTSFDEHAGVPDVPELSRMAKLPPNVFSNAPLAKAGEAANVLLLDSLNTEMADQSYVRSQMIKYIQGIRPGTRLAIFTLGDRLRFVQGFTEDPALLMAAMNGKNGAGNPERSSLLQTAAEQNANQQLVSQMQAMAATTGSADIQAAASSLAQFLVENTSSQIGVRVSRTLEAIEQLAMYLRAIPGRKNVIWFSGSFPLNTLPNDPNMMRDYGPEVGRTANLLAAARIAIYPIGVGAMGLAPNRMYDFSATQMPNETTDKPEQQMTQIQSQSLDQESTERVQNNASLEELADNTGGQFFINTNGFNDVLDHVIKTGTYYYTLTYSPTNQKMNGELRRIQIKLTDGKYKLAYRRGYYATNDFMAPVVRHETNGDPLRPLMDHGTPDSTGILYTMKVVPAAQPQTLKAGRVSDRAGDNDKLTGTVTRYTVTFTVSPEHLALETSADGLHHGSVEVTLLAYNADGTPVNWMVRMLQVRVPPERYAQAQANGVGFNLELDVPASGVYLRSGLYDMGSNKAGTMEIPLAAVVVSVAHDPARSSPAPAPAAAASANIPALAGGVSPTESDLSVAAALEAAKQAAVEAAQESEEIDIPSYCSDIGGKEEHSSSLAAVCEFVLNLRKKLSDVICDRETKRYWMTESVAFIGPGAVTDVAQHSDVVKVHVTYHDGQEYYSDFRLDGQPVSATAPGLAAAWSHGEFATLLASIFAPSSKTQFHYSRERELHSAPALVFEFKVAAQDNHLYFLESRNKVWFPEYAGTIWIDARTSSLLRLQLETAYMPSYPIRHAKAEIEYATLLLGDGTSMVLPTNSNDQICDVPPYDCTRSVIRFTNWHKFHATAHIVGSPTH